MGHGPTQYCIRPAMIAPFVKGVNRIRRRSGGLVAHRVIRLWGFGFSVCLFWRGRRWETPSGTRPLFLSEQFFERPGSGAGSSACHRARSVNGYDSQGAPRVRGKGTKCDVMEQDGTKMGSRASIHRLDGQGRATGDPMVRRQRCSLVPRACARAFGVGWGVESPTPDYSGASLFRG